MHAVWLGVNDEDFCDGSLKASKEVRASWFHLLSWPSISTKKDKLFQKNKDSALELNIVNFKDSLK
jgi:hypothetical protein